MLTTHYLELCKRLDKYEHIQNFHMDVITTDEIGSEDNSNSIYNKNFKYTYKMENGISTIKGGIKVLIDLNYTKEIIDTTSSIIKELVI